MNTGNNIDSGQGRPTRRLAHGWRGRVVHGGGRRSRRFAARLQRWRLARYGGVYWTKILRSELDEESLGELGKAWEHHGSRSVTRVPPVSRGFLACHKLSLPFPSHQPSRSVPSPSPGLPPFPNPQIHSLSILTSALPKDSRRLPPSPRTLVSGDRASSAFGM